ncbi:MAG: hypothetical protein HZB42_11105 [Sphingobacteriales bacterium]|nr:hypothetical protein [Sphingobacteriales bacterium]
MKNIFIIHWNETELKEKIAPLKKAGYKVGYHFSQETTANFKDNLPEALVICLDRLPSHGRAYAEWMWEAKKRQHIPIIFCGGQPDKVEATRLKFPKAIYCSNENLVDMLMKLK